MGDRLGIPRALSIFIFFFNIWNPSHRLHYTVKKNYHFSGHIKKVTFGSYGSGRVYIASRVRTTIFTHPIFESDFDCLTGKNHLHAQSLLSPIASDKHETFKK